MQDPAIGCGECRVVPRLLTEPASGSAAADRRLVARLVAGAEVAQGADGVDVGRHMRVLATRAGTGSEPHGYLLLCV